LQETPDPEGGTNWEKNKHLLPGLGEGGKRSPKRPKPFLEGNGLFHGISWGLGEEKGKNLILTKKRNVELADPGS